MRAFGVIPAVQISECLVSGLYPDITGALEITAVVSQCNIWC